MILIPSILLTMTGNAGPRPGFAILVRNGSIEELGPSARIIQRHPRQKMLRLDNAVLMPGLVNLHAHLELPPLLRTIRAGSFPEWIVNLIAAKRTLGNRQYVEAARRNVEALISTGTTTVGEICTHGASPGILHESGLRCVIYREVIGMGTSLPAVRGPLRASLLVRPGISPHSPYTVSETILQKIQKVSARRKYPLAMHVAESKDETMLLQGKKSGLDRLYHFAGWKTDCAPSAASSFGYLDDLGMLGPDFLAVHAVQATSSDVEILRRTRTPVAHCPRSNRETSVGRMPLKQMLDAGITVGLGTDSLASVASLNMWDEMRYALNAHRHDGISATDIFRIATVNGARALGFGKEIGTIAPDRKADLIAVPLPSKNTGDLYSDLLRETKTCIMSMVNGKILFSR